MLRQITVLQSVDSTNRYLTKLPRDQQHGHAVLADRQTAGQGRRGRNWHSPPGCNVYLSLGWEFAVSNTHMARLPLAVAVIVARAVKKAGVSRPGIKWPNDVQIDGRKVAGILVELKSGGANGFMAIIGIGVNVSMPPSASTHSAISQEWTDLATHLSEPRTPGLRDHFIVLLIAELLSGLKKFSRYGFDSFAADWAEKDVLKGREVTVVSQDESFSGKVAGYSEQGALQLDMADGHGSRQTREFFAGEVSVRPRTQIT